MSRFSQFASTGAVTGEVKEFINNSLPEGYLQLNGQCVCKTTYQNLYNVLGDQDPPASDVATLGPILPPSGYNCQCFVATASDCSCIVYFSVFHCTPAACPGKISARLCYVTSSGCSGFVDENSGGCWSSYYGSWQAAPCGAYAISAGYDCNTQKLYAAVFYSITYDQGGNCRCNNYVRVFNLTDCTATSAYICACCYYESDVRVFGCSCIIQSRRIYGICNAGRFCYPTASVGPASIISSSSIGIFQVGSSTKCYFPNNIFINGSLTPLFIGSAGRNPTLLFCAGMVCYCWSYSCYCYLDGAVVFQLDVNCGTFTGFGCNGYFPTMNGYLCSAFTNLPNCYSNRLFGGYTNSFYCNSIYVGVTRTHTASYCLTCYGGSTRTWSEPGSYAFSRILFPKSCYLDKTIICTIPNIEILTPTDATNFCVGPAEVIYIPKCNTYHVNKATLASGRPCCHCCGSTYSYGVYGSMSCLPVIQNTNCLGITTCLSDSAFKFNTTILPYRIQDGELSLYGYSTLGAASTVFLVPNVPHPTPGLKYFIKS